MSEHKEKRQYTREFKIEAVRLYEASGKSMRVIEQELGITPFLLSKWVQQYRVQEAAAFPGKGKIPETEAELQRLRREVEILRQERDILHLPWRAVPGKKAVIIFSEPKR